MELTADVSGVNYELVGSHSRGGHREGAIPGANEAALVGKDNLNGYLPPSVAIDLAPNEGVDISRAEETPLATVDSDCPLEITVIDHLHEGGGIPVFPRKVNRVRSEPNFRLRVGRNV